MTMNRRNIAAAALATSLIPLWFPLLAWQLAARIADVYAHIIVDWIGEV